MITRYESLCRDYDVAEDIETALRRALDNLREAASDANAATREYDEASEVPTEDELRAVTVLVERMRKRSALAAQTIADAIEMMDNEKVPTPAFKGELGDGWDAVEIGPAIYATHKGESIAEFPTNSFPSIAYAFKAALDFIALARTHGLPEKGVDKELTVIRPYLPTDVAESVVYVERGGKAISAHVVNAYGSIQRALEAAGRSALGILGGQDSSAMRQVERAFEVCRVRSGGRPVRLNMNATTLRQLLNEHGDDGNELFSNDVLNRVGTSVTVYGVPVSVSKYLDNGEVYCEDRFGYVHA